MNKYLIILSLLLVLAACSDMQIVSDDNDVIGQEGFSASKAIMFGSDPLSLVFPHVGSLNPDAGMSPAYMSGTEFTWFNHCRLALDSTRDKREKLLLKHFEYYEASRTPNISKVDLMRIQREVRDIMSDIDVMTPAQCK